MLSDYSLWYNFMKQVAEKCNDAQMADFIESEFLEEQVKYSLIVHN